MGIDNDDSRPCSIDPERSLIDTRPAPPCGVSALRPVLIAAAISGAVCTVFAAVLWGFFARHPNVIIIIGATLTTSRALTGFLIAGGVRLSRRRTDQFPDGLYKLENLLALVIGSLVVIGAYALGRYALAAALAGRDIFQEYKTTLVFIAIATVVGLVLGVFKWIVARRTGSVALRADAAHSFVDAAAGAVLCAGLALDLAGVRSADAVAAVAVSLAVIWAGGSIVYEAIRVLLDASVERDLLDAVRGIALATPLVTGVMAVSGRNCGSFRFIRLRLALATDDLAAAETIAGTVKAAVRARIPNVDEVVVEFGEQGAAASATASALTPPAVLRAVDDTMSPPAAIPTGRVQLAPTERAEVISILVSILMASAMLVTAWFTASVAVLAEGIDTLVDIIASLAVLAGIRFAARHSQNFPLGLYKVENLVATGIGVLILFSGYELAREAIGRMLAGESPVEAPGLVIAVMLGVAAATLVLAAYKGRVGKAYRSPSLLADARHASLDAGASAGVALSVGLQWAGVPHMDSVAALMVVGVLLWGGVGLIRDGLRVLLDASLEGEVLQTVRDIVEAQPGVRRLVAVKGRNSGSYRFVALRIVPDDATVAAADRAAERIAEAVRAQLEHIDQVSVEFVSDAST
nr:cation diffusion facilitator family transporter [uncultured Thiodictyon sp.]